MAKNIIIIEGNYYVLTKPITLKDKTKVPSGTIVKVLSAYGDTLTVKTNEDYTFTVKAKHITKNKAIDAIYNINYVEVEE